MENTEKKGIYAYSTFGYEGSIVSVETDLRRGIPAVDIVGLADGQVKESRERVRAAFRNSGIEFPSERILMSLSPADLKKEGAGFDLPMALSILSEQNNYPALTENNVLAMGELELSGRVRPVRGVRAAVESAMENGIFKFIVPEENVNEALSVDGVQVMGVSSLSEAHEKLKANEYGTFQLSEIKKTSKDIIFDEEALNLEESFFTGGKVSPVKVSEMNLDGYYEAARAIEIAIAGKHNILLNGNPGCGKTILAETLFPALTPQLTSNESQSTTRIWSLAGLTKSHDSMIKKAPFRMPYQTASIEGICGGGTQCRPGEISLAHNGILFLDEAAEFRSSVLQMMRVPLEKKTITLSRAGRSTVYPANFQLVMATNPCPCGNFGNSSKICLCSEKSVDLYWKKFSAPLLDRVDIKVTVQKDENDSRKITIPQMKKHIENAFRIQRENPHYNSALTPQEIAEKCKLNGECQEYFESKYTDKSERSKANTLKIALTIANMENRTEIAIDDLKEAVELNAPVFEKPQEFKHEPKNEAFETNTVDPEIKRMYAAMKNDYEKHEQEESKSSGLVETVIDLKNGKTYTQPYQSPAKEAPIEKTEPEIVQEKSEEENLLEKNNLPDFVKSFKADIDDQSNSDFVVIHNAQQYINTLQTKLVEALKTIEKQTQEKKDLTEEIENLRQPKHHKRNSGISY